MRNYTLLMCAAGSVLLLGQVSQAAIGYQAAGYNAPGYNAPGYNAPGYNAPGYNAPGYNAPGYNAPGYNSTSYQGDSGSAPAWQGGDMGGSPVTGQALLTLGSTQVNSFTLSGTTLTNVALNGSQLQGMKGTTLVKGADLIGAQFQIPFQNGTYTARIDDAHAVTALTTFNNKQTYNATYNSPTDIWVYRIRVNAGNGPGAASTWPIMCGASTGSGVSVSDTSRYSMFFRGSVATNGAYTDDASNAHMSISCTYGTMAKAVWYYGYKPWAGETVSIGGKSYSAGVGRTVGSVSCPSAPVTPPTTGCASFPNFLKTDGKTAISVSARKLWVTAFNALMANYTGDGLSFTRFGAHVDVYDVFGLNIANSYASTNPASSYAFAPETTWTTFGAGIGGGALARAYNGRFSASFDYAGLMDGFDRGNGKALTQDEVNTLGNGTLAVDVSLTESAGAANFQKYFGTGNIDTLSQPGDLIAMRTGALCSHSASTAGDPLDPLCSPCTLALYQTWPTVFDNPIDWTEDMAWNAQTSAACTAAGSGMGSGTINGGLVTKDGTQTAGDLTTNTSPNTVLPAQAYGFTASDSNVAAIHDGSATTYGTFYLDGGSPNQAAAELWLSTDEMITSLSVTAPSSSAMSNMQFMYWDAVNWLYVMVPSTPFSVAAGKSYTYSFPTPVSSEDVFVIGTAKFNLAEFSVHGFTPFSLTDYARTPWFGYQAQTTNSLYMTSGSVASNATDWDATNTQVSFNNGMGLLRLDLPHDPVYFQGPQYGYDVHEVVVKAGSTGIPGLEIYYTDQLMSTIGYSNATWTPATCLASTGATTAQTQPATVAPGGVFTCILAGGYVPATAIGVLSTGTTQWTVSDLQAWAWTPQSAIDYWADAIQY